MQAWSKRYAPVFGVGFIIFFYALGIGATQGELTSSNAVLQSLRHLGGGLMASGMMLWTALEMWLGCRIHCSERLWTSWF